MTVTGIPVETQVGRPRSGAHRRVRRGRLSVAMLFLLPAALLYLIFVVVPSVQAVYYSLYRWNGIEPLTRFAGLDNYRLALGDTIFRSSVGHTVVIIVLSLVIQLPFALWVAIVLNRQIRGRTFFRIVFFMPYVLSEVVTGILWNLLLRPDGGPVNSMLAGVGLDSLTNDWLAEPSTVLPTLFVIISWKYFGFHMILYLAGLQQIPRVLEEAATIDGASRWQVIRHVVLPLLGPTIRVSVFLSIIGALQLFDLVWVTTRGGPVNASSTIVTYMIDKGLRTSRVGFACGVAVVLFAASLVLALIYQRYVLRRDLDGAVTNGRA
jgi:raffinose/stachyose/melibiose transport system permease protein